MSEDNIVAALRVVAESADDGIVKDDIENVADAIEALDTTYISARGGSIERVPAANEMEDGGGVYAREGTKGARQIKSRYSWSKCSPEHVGYLTKDWEQVRHWFGE